MHLTVGRRYQWQPQPPPPQQPLPPDMPGAANVPLALLTPTTDSRRVTLALWQAGHSTAACEVWT
jgi:hypothetical protein